MVRLDKETKRKRIIHFIRSEIDNNRSISAQELKARFGLKQAHRFIRYYFPNEEFDITQIGLDKYWTKPGIKPSVRQVIPTAVGGYNTRK